MRKKQKEPEMKKSAKSSGRKLAEKTPERSTPRSKKTSSQRREELCPEAARKQGIKIVGIGASAGGLEAMACFFKAMPADSGMGFVVVVHLSPDRVSILSELLQKYTVMPVHQIAEGMAVEPGHVYVVPPDKKLSILAGILMLTEFAGPHGSYLPIDSFFCSLAEDQKSRAVGIILSGTGSDGSMGVKAIKANMGLTLVQDEGSAKFDGMPRSAIGTGMVDFVLSPEKMPDHLVKYKGSPTLKAKERKLTNEDIALDELQKIFASLRARTNHDFSLYKYNTICRRIEHRMKVHQTENISQYVRYLQENDREADMLFKDLLIGVTNFFRDQEAFGVLGDTFIPRLLENKPDDYVVRAWVPGCASGEEAYSLAIILHECIEKMGRRCQIQIFGTDLDEDAVNVARGGIYPESIGLDISEERLKRFFTKRTDGRYQVKKLIRGMLVFAPQNLIRDPPFTKLDILSCRNLLIYLGSELQAKLLPLFHYCLKPDGLLFLGTSESIGQFSDLFVVSDRKRKIFRRRQAAGIFGANAAFIPEPYSRRSKQTDFSRVIDKEADLCVLQLVETILHERNTPPCVIINDNSDVLYIHGRTGQFLEPAQGKVTSNIIQMARYGLKGSLMKAIKSAKKCRHEVVERGLEWVGRDGKIVFDLKVKPIQAETVSPGLFMVVFEETKEPGRSTKGNMTKPTSSKSKKKSVKDLENELLRTRADLRSTIEELQTANEELKSTNEEMQSTNEELQSTNEELETSKEELQSVNEESNAVNAELQGRIDELSSSNDDIKNLLDSTNIAAVFLDVNMNVRRFTPKVKEIIPLAEIDYGRPVTDLASTLENVDIVSYAHKVLKDLAVREVEVRSVHGRHYVMRVRPYRTIAQVVDGVVYTFEDISDRKRLYEESMRNEQLLKTAVSSAPVEIVVAHVDSNARYTWIYNPSEDFNPETVLGKRDDEIDDNEGTRELSRLKEQVLASGTGHVGDISFPFQGGLRNCRITITPEFDSQGKVKGATTSSVDISLHK